MASIKKRGNRYLVRWRDPDGTNRGRTCPDRGTAERLRREVERAVACGEAWSPPDARVAPLLVELDDDDKAVGGAFHEFMTTKGGTYAAGTQRHYDRALRRFAIWLALRNPRRRRLTTDLLTLEAVEDWFLSLQAGEEGISAATARLYVSAVRQAWEWMRKRQAFRDWVAPAERPDLGPVPMSPIARAPSWEQMDAVIAAAYRRAHEARTYVQRDGWLWRARLATVLRFTGLRVSQAMGLRWEDFDLAEGMLHVRPDLGKTVRERQGRHIPISPHLVAELAGWGTRDGFVVAPEKTQRESDPRHMRQLWEAAKVPRAFWAPPPGRKKGNCHHGFRKGFKTGLADAGVPKDVRDFLVGHHLGIDEHYLENIRRAQEAVKKIPELTDAAQAGRVLAFPGAAGAIGGR